MILSTFCPLDFICTRHFVHSTFCPFQLLTFVNSTFRSFNLSFIRPYYTLNVVYLRFCHSSYSLFAHLSISTFIDQHFIHFSYCTIDQAYAQWTYDHFYIRPPIVYLTICPFNRLFPFDLLFFCQPVVHSTLFIFNILSIRAVVYSIFCPIDLFLIHYCPFNSQFILFFFFYLRFCPFSIFHVRPLVHFTIRATVLSIIWQFKLISSGPFTILPIVYLTFCPFNHFFIRPFFYTTFCSSGL